MSGGKGELAPHILHVLPQGASVELISAFGNKLRHTLVTQDGELPTGLRRSAYLKPASNFPALEGLPMPGRMLKLARAITPFDLVLTHGPEALDVAMAHTLFKDAMNLPPLVHHEYAPDQRRTFRRKWYRRIALGKSAGVVVPGERLEEAALVDWQQPMGRVKRIAPGIDTKAFAKKPKMDGFRLIKHSGENWVGTWPDDPGVSGIARLVRAFANLDENWQLIVLGERQNTTGVEAEIDRLGLNDRVYFPGAVKEPARVLGLFDIFVDLGVSPIFPERLVQAMSAAVPVIAPREGGTADIVSEPNREWLTEGASESMFAANLHALAKDGGLRKAIGEANRVQAVQEFDREKVIATFRRLYSSAMRREF